MPAVFFHARPRARCLRAIAALCLFMAALSPLKAAGTRWDAWSDTVFVHPARDQGLPNVVVTALAQDGEGFLWAGTQGGLARWDGYRFKTWLADPGRPGALPDSRIRTLHTDKSGQLWIGTWGGGLVRYVRDEDRFASVGKALEGTIHALADDDGNGIWAATQSSLEHVQPRPDGGMDVTRFVHDDANPHSLPAGHLRALLRDRDGILWVGSSTGLAYRRGHDHQFVQVPFPGHAKPAVHALAQDSAGGIWIGTLKGAYHLEPRTGRVSRVPAAATGWVAAIAEIRPGVLWLGTYGQGIVEWSPASGQARTIRHDRTLPAGLKDDDVWALLRDRSGLVWVGSQNGLGVVAGQTRPVLSLFGGTGRRNGIRDPDVTAVLAARDGRVWLGLGNKGVDIVDPVRGRVAALQPDARHPRDALPEGFVFALAEARDDTVYIGTVAGLYRTRPDRPGVTRVERAGGKADLAIQTLAFADGHLWVGSREEGLFVLDERRGAPATWRPVPGLADPRVTALLSARGGGVWAGTEAGLERVGPDGRVVHAGLDSTAVSSLLYDRRGRLWVGTLGQGIALAEAPEVAGPLRFRFMGKAAGLPDANVDKLLEDERGRIWASTDDGLAVMAPDGRSFRALHAADGVAIPNFWINAGARTAAGELVFGGAGGIDVVRPDLPDRHEFAPPIVVTDLRVGGQSVPAARLNEGKPVSILIRPGANRLAVEFAALDYSSPAMNRYAFRLDGYDRDWITTDAGRRLAAYTNLPPGDYRLLLRGTNREGGAARILAMPFRVLPAWYQTTAFRVAAGLMGLLLVAGIVRVRTRWLRLRKQELEQEVARQTRALAQSAETLRQLGEVGRDITANLAIHGVFESMHRHVARLIAAPHFAVYRFEPGGDALVPVYSVDDGKPLPDVRIPLDSPVSNSARAVRERREILVEVDPDLPSPGHIAGTRRMLTVYFVPLVAGEQVLGVMTIQSGQPRAFGEQERMMFRTLCAYAAIALANSDAYQAAQSARMETAAALAELKAAQAQLIQQEKRVTIGQLVANVAHEINTPIAAIRSSADVAADAFRQVLAMLPVLALARSDEAGLAFAGLLARCTAPERRMTGSRESRAIRRDLQARLAAAGIGEPAQAAEVLCACQVRDDVTPWLPMLRDPEAPRMLALAGQIARVTGSTGNIGEAVGRVSRIVFALKTFAGSGGRGVPAETDLAASLETVLDLYQHALRQGVVVVRDWTVVPLVTCVQEEMQQVFANLMQNALQAMDGQGTLTLSLYAEAGAVVIVFADTGHGMDESVRRRAFEPFFTTRADGEGSGLGLDIVRRIIERHHGTVTLDSAVGAGTRVTLRLPAAQPAQT